MKTTPTYITTLSFMDNLEKRLSKEIYRGDCYNTAVLQAERYRASNEEQTSFHHYKAEVEEDDGRLKVMLQYRVYSPDGNPRLNWMKMRAPISNTVM